MGMSFQGPPPPPPPFWREPAFWFTAVAWGAETALALLHTNIVVEAAAAGGAALVVSVYSYLRLAAAREDRQRQQTGMVRKRGVD